MTITTINNIVSSGTAAARPASPALATPASGSDPSVIYYARDTGAVSMWNFNGSAWATIGGGTVTSVSLSAPLGGGTITSSGTLGTSSYTAHGVLIGAGSSALAVTSAGTSTQVLTSNGASSDPTFQNAVHALAAVTTSSSQSTVTISIPSGYTSFEILVWGRNTTAATAGLSLQFNSDTATNYTYGYLLGTAGTASSGSASSNAAIAIGNLPGTNIANHSGNCVIRVTNYTSTSFYKSVTGTACCPNGGVGSALYVQVVSGTWANTAAITSVTVTCNNFADGSTVQVVMYP